jgi:hypothetical protein
MPPKRSTRSHSMEQAGPSATKGTSDLPSDNTIAQALNKVAEVLQHLVGTSNQEEPQPVMEGDQALEKFLKFHPPQFYGRLDQE